MKGVANVFSPFKKTPNLDQAAANAIAAIERFSVPLSLMIMSISRIRGLAYELREPTVEAALIAMLETCTADMGAQSSAGFNDGLKALREIEARIEAALEAR